MTYSITEHDEHKCYVFYGALVFIKFLLKDISPGSYLGREDAEIDFRRIFIKSNCY